jgi:hypothetical protein
VDLAALAERRAPVAAAKFANPAPPDDAGPGGRFCGSSSPWMSKSDIGVSATCGGSKVSSDGPLGFFTRVD